MMNQVKDLNRWKKPPDSEKGITPFGQTLRTGGCLPRVGPAGVLQPLGKQFTVLPQQKELTQHYKRLKHTEVTLININSHVFIGRLHVYCI